MVAPTKYWLAAFALTCTRAFAADGDSVTGAGLVTDSGGQPVRGSSAECWRSGTALPGTTVSCASAGGTSLAAEAAGSAAEAGAAAALAVPQPLAQPLPGNAFAPVAAGANPGYVTDARGWIVRGSQGECWRTSSWSPELATVVGCDGVLARAMPIPAPAPSPKPQPPAAPTQPPVSAAEAPAVAPTPAAPPSAAPPAAGAKPPSAAAPRRGRGAPAVIPPAPPAPAPSAAVPFGEAGAVTQQRVLPTSEKVTLDTDTYFDFDKATLKPAGERNLDALAARIKALSLEVIVATGHADWIGTDAYNQHLSEQRALAVKRYLARQGVPNGRIFTEGKGEKQPVASNATREGRAQNRRVEVEMVGTRTR